MRKWLCLIVALLVFCNPVSAAESYKLQEVFDTEQDYDWTAIDVYSSWIQLGGYHITQYSRSYKIQNSIAPFRVAFCTSRQISDYSSCPTKDSLANSTVNYLTFNQSHISEGRHFVHILRLVDEEPPTPDPDPTPDPEPEPGGGENPGGDGGGNVGLTLPKVNILDDPVVSGTFWNYLGSVFYLGMPFLLIAVALLVVEMVLHLLIEVVKKAKQKEVDDDDDDW